MAKIHLKLMTLQIQEIQMMQKTKQNIQTCENQRQRENLDGKNKTKIPDIFYRGTE